MKKVLISNERLDLTILSQEPHLTHRLDNEEFPAGSRRPPTPCLHGATVLMVLAVLAGAAGTADAGSPSEQRKFKSQFQGKFDTPALATGVQVPTGAGSNRSGIAILPRSAATAAWPGRRPQGTTSAAG